MRRPAHARSATTAACATGRTCSRSSARRATATSPRGAATSRTATRRRGCSRSPTRRRASRRSSRSRSSSGSTGSGSTPTATARGAAFREALEGAIDEIVEQDLVFATALPRMVRGRGGRGGDGLDPRPARVRAGARRRDHELHRVLGANGRRAGNGLDNNPAGVPSGPRVGTLELDHAGAALPQGGTTHARTGQSARVAARGPARTTGIHAKGRSRSALAPGRGGAPLRLGPRRRVAQAAVGATPKRGGVLKFARNFEPVTLGPFGAADNGTIWTIMMIYDQLVEYQPGALDPQPDSPSPGGSRTAARQSSSISARRSSPTARR